MNILGIDPGQTSGWCLYDSKARRVIAAGQFPDWRTAGIDALACASFDTVVIERPVAHGPTRPQVVDCAYVAGRIVQAWEDTFDGNVVELTRLDVKKELTAATHGEVQVRNDATAWAALKLLHGEGCDKKGGALHGVKAHARAALAVAVAFSLRVSAHVAGEVGA